jgi:hypothetical protein
LFLDGLPQPFPVAVKPDHGERGAGVSIIYDWTALERRLDSAEDLILQEFAGGNEISVFYYRFPEDERGRIFSVTEKVFPEVIGDGRRTLEELILDDPRAVCLADAYLSNFPESSASSVPARGETVRLIEIGTHSRGAIFRDGRHLLSDKTAAKIDEICREYAGFYFGRFDLRLTEAGARADDPDFRIIELNGVTSESTNIYDPRFTLPGAYRVLFRQWKLAFEIGAANIARGATSATWRELLALLRTFFQRRM